MDKGVWVLLQKDAPINSVSVSESESIRMGHIITPLLS